VKQQTGGHQIRTFTSLHWISGDYIVFLVKLTMDSRDESSILSLQLYCQYQITSAQDLDYTCWRRWGMHYAVNIIVGNTRCLKRSGNHAFPEAVCCLTTYMWAIGNKKARKSILYYISVLRYLVLVKRCWFVSTVFIVR
jgi:hypothetical protein